MRQLARVALFVSFASLNSLGCKARQETSDGRALIGDRALLGAAATYDFDPALSAPLTMEARRRLGWLVAQKVLSDVEVKSSAGSPATVIPAWQTWYSGGEFESMFAELYRYSDDPELKAARASAPEKNGVVPFPKSMVDTAFQRYIKSARSGHLPAWKKKDLEEHFKKFKTEEDDRRLGVHEEVGRSAKGTTVFNEPLLAHLLKDYTTIYERCIVSSPSEFVEGNLPPADPNNFSACFSAEMPVGAVAIKTTWQKVGKDGAGKPLTVAAFDTSAEGMKKILGTKPTMLQAVEGTGEQRPVRQVDPPPSQIFTVKLKDNFGEVSYRLTGLHIMTKELRHWVWVSLWWSDEPDQDFGADRPEDMRRPWQNYKMCVVTDFAETDSDPGKAWRGGRADSLAKALDAVSAASSPYSWCSNPYIESGAGNARTNCIGCHQHAGVAFESGETFLDECPDARKPQESKEACMARQLKKREKFPYHGRSPVRQNFPNDYMFSLDMPAPDLAGKIRRGTE